MSFNFIKLENRKYELTPSTSEHASSIHAAFSALRCRMEEEEEDGDDDDDAGAGSSIRRRKLEGRMLREAARHSLPWWRRSRRRTMRKMRRAGEDAAGCDLLLFWRAVPRCHGGAGMFRRLV